MRIRPLEIRDIEPILLIQAASPEAAQWTSWDYERAARGEMACWIAETENEFAGFLVARLVASDVEILNVAVHPTYRRRGMATALLKELILWPPASSAENIFLEVRESNSAAIQFYEKHGLKLAGRRKDYYREPVEDALLLQRETPTKLI